MNGTALSTLPLRRSMLFAGGVMPLPIMGGGVTVYGTSGVPLTAEIAYTSGELLLATTVVGFEVGTGGAATVEYVKERGNKGYPFLV